MFNPQRLSFIIILLWLVSLEGQGQNLTLSIIGATEKETKTIDSLDYKREFEDYQSLNTEVDALIKQLTNYGYIESRLTALNKESDSSYLAKFTLKERFTTIRIYNKELISADLLKVVNAKIHDDHFSIPIERLEESLNIINSEMANRSDPFSNLRLTSITKNSDLTLSAKLSTSETENRTIDRLIIKGYEKFPKSYIKHYLKIKKGQAFNLKKIKQKTDDLDNLQFANILRDPEVLFSKDSTILYMYIEKNRSNTFDGYLGFGTNENTNKIEFDGYLDLRLTNNLNYGETLNLLYKSDENDQQTLNLNLKMPFLFGTPLGVDLNLNIFRRDSTFSSISQRASLNYQIDPKSTLLAGIKAETSTDLLDSNSSLITDYSSTIYFLGFEYLKRQNKNLLFPINFLFNATSGFGNRTFGNTKDPQYNFILESFKIFNLNDRNSIYVRLSGQYLISNSYLENELPRFGGINSIRGFEENSLLANLFGVLNTEYRYRLNSSIYVHSVIDAAYFENQITDQREKLFGFGFGFGLLTQAGLFKFNYTSGKTENQKFSLSDSKIHISLTALF